MNEKNVFYFPNQDLAGPGGGIFFSFNRETWDVKTSV